MIMRGMMDMCTRFLVWGRGWRGRGGGKRGEEDDKFGGRREGVVRFLPNHSYQRRSVPTSKPLSPNP